MRGKDRVRRDQQIWEGHRQGVRYRTLAQSFGLSQDHVGRIVRRERDQRRGSPLEAPGAWERFDELIEQLSGTMEELALVAVTSNNSGQQIAARRLYLRCLDRQQVLLRDAGLLPHAVGRLSNEVLGRFSETLGRVWEEQDLPVDALAPVHDLLAAWLRSEAPRRLR